MSIFTIHNLEIIYIYFSNNKIYSMFYAGSNNTNENKNNYIYITLESIMIGYESVSCKNKF
jgi:hypothetical protein